MKMEVALLSKPGGRVRNEDACGYWTSDGSCCWVLSDGAGGHAGGDVASRSVVATIVREFAAAPQTTPDALASLIVHANDVLLREQHAEYRLRDMRATVVVLAFDHVQQKACWGHVGDSRIYGFRSGHVRFQSRDHSVLQRMIDAGLGDAALLRTHPQRSVLLAALGSLDGVQPEVPLQAETVREGDVFLLCSDGLWEYVDESLMEARLAASATAESWLAALEAELLARAERGHDNYSAIAVWLGDRAETTQFVISR